MHEKSKPKPIDATKIRSQSHLIAQILNQSGGAPNYALLLGAGASVSSGIPSASQMVREWRLELYRREEPKESFDEWLNSRDWYQRDEEYSILFEMLYDQPVQRREYVEKKIVGKKPTWGYAYLTNLLWNSIFNVAFTTNFDDLLNEACFLYTEHLRPIVAAYDSSIEGIRITADRPKIIKLHGDFLYDNIKNTIRELETLEQNTRNKLSQFALEYGLVVIGYGGNDRSVMDSIELLLNQPQHLRHGIYWCLLKGDVPSRRLQALMKYDRVYAVYISGFDQLMAAITQQARLGLPPLLANPYRVVRERTSLITNLEESLQADNLISSHAKFVRRQLIRGPKGLPDILPLEARSALARDRGDLDEAIGYLEEAHEAEPANLEIAYSLGGALAEAVRLEELEQLVDKVRFRPSELSFLLLFLDKDELLVEKATEALSIEPGDYIARINRAIAHDRLSRIPERDADLEVLESQLSAQVYRPALDAGIAALRAKKQDMLRFVEEALDKEMLTPGSVRYFPVFEKYRDDADLLALLEKWEAENIELEPDEDNIEPTNE